MAKKIDLTRAKEFLFNHGEKVALGACAFIGVVLGLWGIWSAAGAGVAEGTSKPFHVVMLERKTQITQSFNQPAPLDDGAAKKINIDWPNLKSSHQMSPYIANSEAGLDKRRRPAVLPIAADQIRWDYVAGLVYTHRTPDTVRTKKTIYGLAPEGSEVPVAPPTTKKGKKDPTMPDPGAATVSLPFQQLGRAERMVIVHARFPMKEQVEAFRRALNLQSQEDQFVKNRNDLPRPEGIDVVRVEVLGEDKYSAPVTIMGLDPKDGKFTMNPRLEDLLRKAIYDERVADAMRDWIWAGLMTPMPKLANKKYPQFEFKDFDIDWTFLDDLEKRPDAMVAGPGPGPGPMPPRPLGKEGGSGLPGFGKGKERGPGGIERPPMGMEMNPRPAGAEFRAVEIPEGVLDISHPGLIARIYKTKDDEFNPYHVFGKKRPEREKVAGPEFNPPAAAQANQDAFFDPWDVNPPQGAGAFGAGPGPGPGPGVGPGGKRPMGFERPPGGEKNGGIGGVGGGAGTVFTNWDRDALVRFIDVDVKPGKTYKYAIRVRLANPNFGLPVKDLEFGDLALHKELPPSAWVDTPNITIPQEFHVYAIDQQLLDDWADDKGPKKGGVVPIYQPSLVNNFTAFQIHQWVDLKKDYAKPDPFVIGDWVIGERQLVRKGEPIGKRLTVQAPVWLTLKDAFEVPQHLDPDVKDKKKSAKGVHTDLILPDGKAPILVDFTGGKRLNKNNGLDEETAVDALVLMPDGKLKVFNSREAMDLKSADEDVRRDAKDRHDRLVNARKRVEEVLSGAGNGPGGNNPAMPKSPVGPALPGAKGGS